MTVYRTPAADPTALEGWLRDVELFFPLGTLTKDTTNEEIAMRVRTLYADDIYGPMPVIGWAATSGDDDPYHWEPIFLQYDGSIGKGGRVRGSGKYILGLSSAGDLITRTILWLQGERTLKSV